MALTTISNPYLGMESYIYIYGPDRWITSPNVTIVSTKVVQIMDTRLDEGRKWARRCTLAIQYEVVPRNARVKVKICDDGYNALDFTCGRQRYHANPRHVEEEILENIREPMEGINSTFDRIEDRLDRICDRLDGILAGLDGVLEGVNEKFGLVDYKLEWIGGRLNGNCVKLDSILMLDEEWVKRQGRGVAGTRRKLEMIEE